jgi:hypothetical protein
MGSFNQGVLTMSEFKKQRLSSAGAELASVPKDPIPATEPAPVPKDPIPATEPVSARVSSVELPKKIVAKDIVGRKAMAYRKDGDGQLTDDAPRALYRVFGIVSGTRAGESAYGAFLEFTGSFEAIRFTDRQRFQSTRLFLQQPAEGLLLDAYTRAARADATATVKFAFDVGVRPSPKWIETDLGNSYEYTIKTVIESNQHDPLHELRGSMDQGLPALPQLTS